MSFPWKPSLGLFSLLVLATMLRIGATIAWHDDLQRDPDAYYGLAERLLEGHGFVAPDGRPTAYRPPLYPMLLATVLPGGISAVAALQIVLGVGTVAVTVAAGQRAGLGRYSLLAGLLIAVDPLLLRYTPQIMTEVTCTFLAALLLWSAVVMQQRLCDESTCRKRLCLAGLCLGVLFGLATLSRPTFWAWGALAGVAWLVGNVRNRSQVQRPLLTAVFIATGVLIAIAPWAVRNAGVVGEPIVTTTHGGYTLLLANNPVYWKEVVLAPSRAVWSGESLDAWQRSVEDEMAADGIAYDDEVARDRWMKAEAIEQIRQHPALFLRAGVYRLSRLWDVVPAEGVAAPVRLTVAIFYLVTQVLALAGLYWWGLGVRRGDQSALALTAGVLLIAAFTTVHFVYWTDARMRAPCLPAVALLAAFACSRILGVRREGPSSGA